MVPKLRAAVKSVLILKSFKSTHMDNKYKKWTESILQFSHLSMYFSTFKCSCFSPWTSAVTNQANLCLYHNHSFHDFTFLSYISSWCISYLSPDLHTFSPEPMYCHVLSVIALLHHSLLFHQMLYSVFLTHSHF